MPSQAFDYSSSEDGQFHVAVHKQLNVAIATDSVKMTLMAATQLAAAADMAEAIRATMRMMEHESIDGCRCGEMKPVNLKDEYPRQYKMMADALKLFDS